MNRAPPAGPPTAPALLVRQLSDWLADTDITLLELRGPGVQVRLRNEGGQVAPLPVEAAPAAAGRAPQPVRSPAPGIFLHAHPLHETPLAAAGQTVEAGTMLALLRIGALLLPVSAPRPGTFIGHAVAHGSTVGYGAVLLHLAAGAVDAADAARAPSP